jgi:hypothetical protein
VFNNARNPVFKISQHLEAVLRRALMDFFSSEGEYAKAFDYFEYIGALVFADLYEKEHPDRGVGFPWGGTRNPAGDPSIRCRRRSSGGVSVGL